MSLPGDWAIIAEGLVKRYLTYARRGFIRRERRIIEALRGVSFKVNWGEVFGLLGPNGAGKTTTVKILTTLLLPDDGNAWVAGYNVVDEPVRVREQIGVVLNVEKGFFWKLTGRENLRYFGMLRGLRGRDLEDRVDEVGGMLGLDKLGAMDKLYEEFSLGMKARLAIARAMLTDPPVLILDEPTLGLDPHSARGIRSLLVRLARRGKAVLITTHNMFEAELICDRVAIINRGRIAAIGTVAELKRLVTDTVPINIVFTGLAEDGLESLEKLVAERLGTPARISGEDRGYRIRMLAKPGEEDRIIAESISMLSSMGLKVHRVYVEEPSLEDVFIKVTGGET